MITVIKFCFDSKSNKQSRLRDTIDIAIGMPNLADLQQPTSENSNLTSNYRDFPVKGRIDAISDMLPTNRADNCSKMSDEYSLHNIFKYR